MATRKYLFLAFIQPLAWATIASASVQTFIGGDSGASDTAPRPNSDAAALAFTNAVSSLGPATIIDFESSVVGPASGLSISLIPGVDVTSINPDNFPEIRSTPLPFGNPSVFGFNTTPGGDNFLQLFGTSAIFDFNPGINFFGAYLSGIEGVIRGQQTLSFDDGTVQQIDIPILAGGVAFVGFSSTGPDITSLTIDFRGTDFVGVDDIQFGSISTNSAVPEPTAFLVWAGMAACCGTLAAKRRR